MSKIQADVAVVGLGPAGLCACVAAAENDLKVVGFEKAAMSIGTAMPDWSMTISGSPEIRSTGWKTWVSNLEMSANSMRAAGIPGIWSPQKAAESLEECGRLLR